MKKSIANWGNYPVLVSDEQSFTHLKELNENVKKTNTTIARGNGRCYGDASLADHTVSTLQFKNILHFDSSEGIFDCESGLTLDSILEVIIPKGWFLPVTPGTKFITIGGAVGSDVHGKNHHVDGSFSNHIVDMDVLVENERLLTCSSTVLPDLFEATCGGMGLTGIITRVKFRLKKIESSYISQKQIKATNLHHLIELFAQHNHYTYSVAWIDCLKKGSSFGRSILILGEHAKLDDLTAVQKQQPLQLPKKKQITFPFNLPSWILNSFTVKVFNFLYYQKNTKPLIENTVGYDPFFYPLDAILHWNRGYGKKGFVQYQFVLPLSAKEGLIEILNKISDSGMGSFLAVLKVFGKQESMISFPYEGYTLALDFPVKDKLFPFLDALDAIVLRHNGRLYMSKDARMKPSVLQKGYPRLADFLAIVKKYNPSGKFSSVQSKRLLLD
jgi:decaprenylphospho-beta-D-ribofuranose 2-oxidase